MQVSKELFALYPPPYDLLADMLFVMALAPLPPLRRAFPMTPFLAVGGRVPLVMWFSRVKELCSRDVHGARLCPEGPGEVPYRELNVVAPLRRRAIFVPGIYASSPFSLGLAQGYGMPKRLVAMSFEWQGGRLESRARVGARESHARARLLTTGRWTGRLMSGLWPRWSWPARFASGREVSALIQATPGLRLARVSGRLALDETWLPEDLPLWPVGLYAPDLRFRLPPPPTPKAA